MSKRHRIRDQLHAAQKKVRYQDTRRKFLLGLSFEKAGLALADHEYIESGSAFEICQTILQRLTIDAHEHDFYRSGELAFHSQDFMEDPINLKTAEALFGEFWKQKRYHNLVRLGGDVLRSGLGEYPKATVLGGLGWYASQYTNEIECQLNEIFDTI